MATQCSALHIRKTRERSLVHYGEEKQTPTWLYLKNQIEGEIKLFLLTSCEHTAIFFFTTALFTCVISASCLFHSDRPDGVLLPLLPSDPVLLQRGCGEEASPLDHRTTGHLSSQVTPRSRLSTPKRAAQIVPDVMFTV